MSVLEMFKDFTAVVLVAELKLNFEFWNVFLMCCGPTNMDRETVVSWNKCVVEKQNSDVVVKYVSSLNHTT